LTKFIYQKYVRLQIYIVVLNSIALSSVELKTYNRKQRRLFLKPFLTNVH